MAQHKWRHSTGFILSAAGSAVGLANVWRFPYLFDNYGWGFLICYILFLCVLGLPLFVSETFIGQSSETDPYHTFKSRNHPFWSIAGTLVITTSFLVSSYYAVIAGWVLTHAVLFQDVVSTSSNALIDRIQTSPWLSIAGQCGFLLLCFLSVYRGLNKGLERTNSILMPCLFMIIICLVILTVYLRSQAGCVSFLYTIKPFNLNATIITEALGQAFFSLSLGQGTIITYGSFLPKKHPLQNWLCPWF